MSCAPLYFLHTHEHKNNTIDIIVLHDTERRSTRTTAMAATRERSA